jgi:non-heme chloroperoxidase
MSGTRDFTVLAVLLVACGSSAPKPTTPPPAPAIAPDTAHHTRRMIEVAPGVALEVLDFGGTGEPIVLLAGLGNTAHVFDDFAPALTDRHRVIAITRRGYGSSSATTGFDVATRAADDLAVLDALKLPRVILAGHSIAGDELSEMAMTHGDRVSGLIYLDASHDHVAVRKMHETAPNFDRPPPADAMASFAGFATWIRRKTNVAIPHGEVLAGLDIGPNGGVRGFKGAANAGELIMAGTKSYELSRITTRALVFLAIDPKPDEMGFDDAAQRAEVERWWPAMVALDAASRADVKTNFRSARLVELSNSHHYVFISDRARVLDEIRAFVASR